MHVLPQQLQWYVNIPERFTTAVAVVWLLVLPVYLQMDEVHAVVFKRLVALLALVQYRIWVSNNAVNGPVVVNVAALVVTATGAVAVTSVYVAVAFSLVVVATVVVAVDGVNVPAVVATTTGAVAVTSVCVAEVFSSVVVATVVVAVDGVNVPAVVATTTGAVAVTSVYVAVALVWLSSLLWSLLLTFSLLFGFVQRTSLSLLLLLQSVDSFCSAPFCFARSLHIFFGWRCLI